MNQLQIMNSKRRIYPNSQQQIRAWI